MAVRASMNVSVTPELADFVQELVASGRYHSASEVFRHGLRMLEQAERGRLLEKWLAEGLTPDEQAKIPADALERFRSRIRSDVQKGLHEARRGAFVDGEEFFTRWKTRLDEAAASESE